MNSLPTWLLAATLGCVGAPRPTVPPAGSVPEPEPSPPTEQGGAAPAAAPPSCGPDERLFGTTCCRTEVDGPAGHTFCHGPNVGAPCQRKGDCDVLCGCDDPNGPPPMQGSSPRGPADGTTGVTGRCLGQIVDGAWYCVIDEDGRVTHFIRN